MNIQKMMQQAQQMQERMQKQMAETVIEASAGGGAVSVKNGRGVLVFSAGADAEERGRVTVWNEDGRKPRAIDPN